MRQDVLSMLRQLGVALISCSLAACAGGGGGGTTPTPIFAVPSGSVATPVDASALTTAKVYSNGTQITSPLAGLLFPLYPVFGAGAQSGVRSESASGAITVTYTSFLGPKSLTFLASEIIDSDTGGFAMQKGTSFVLSEIWNDATTNLDMRYARVGILFDAENGQNGLGFYYFGFETHPTEIPASNLAIIGTADYVGATSGFQVTGTDVVAISGDVRLSVNFATDRMSGAITNLVKTVGTTDVPLGLRFELLRTFSGIFRSGDSAGMLFGTFNAVAESAAFADRCCGDLKGRFFGPAAREVAGGWTYSDADFAIEAAFGVVRDPAQPITAPGVIAVDATKRVGTAVDEVFPLRRGSVLVDALRRLDSAVNLLLRYGTVVAGSGDDAPIAVTFGAADRVAAGGVTTAQRDGVTWREYEQVDSARGDLAYSRFAYLEKAVSPGIVDRPYYFGYETPLANLPVSGSADYYGRTVGTLTTGATTEALAGLVDMHVAFDIGGARFRISNLEVTAPSGARRSLGDVLYFSGPLTITDGQAVFGGDVTVAAGRSGNVSGHFFGPAAEEVAGSWVVGEGISVARGAFGARIATTAHPAGAPRIEPWTSATATDFALDQHLVRTTYSAPFSVSAMTSLANETATLRPRADGGVVLAALRNSVAVGGVLDAASFSTSGYFAFTTPELAMNAHKTGVQGTTTVHLAGDRYLSYGRFGYWADASEGATTQSRGFFFAGSATPAAEVPIQGTATYVGATMGESFSSQGVHRFLGALSLTTDFAARTISGTLGSFDSRAVAGLSPSTLAGTLPFDLINLSGNIAAGTNTFAGTSDARLSGASVATGTFDGRFLGRDAQEVGGKWEVTGTGGATQAWGAFGGAR